MPSCVQYVCKTGGYRIVSTDARSGRTHHIARWVTKLK